MGTWEDEEGAAAVGRLVNEQHVEWADYFSEGFDVKEVFFLNDDDMRLMYNMSIKA